MFIFEHWNGQTDTQTDRQTDTQTHRQTDTQTDRQTDRQTDVQTPPGFRPGTITIHLVNEMTKCKNKKQLTIACAVLLFLLFSF